MILSGKTILEKIQHKELVIDPLTKEQIQPASVDLRLGNHFLVMDEHTNAHLSLEAKAKYKEVVAENEKIVIPPLLFLACYYYRNHRAAGKSYCFCRRKKLDRPLRAIYSKCRLG